MATTFMPAAKGSARTPLGPKIENQLTLIKHIGLRKSTRRKKKLPPPLSKISTLEVPKIPQPPQELQENAPPRRKSKNFEESLGIFRNLEHPPNLPHPPPPPRSRHPRPSPSRPVTTPPTTSWPAETEHQVDLHCHMKKSVATRAESKPFVPRQQAICSDQGPHPPPPQTNFKIETFPSPSLATCEANTAVLTFKNSNLGGNLPPSQSDCRSKKLHGQQTSDW